VGAVPFVGPWPDDPGYDAALLAEGDQRNVADQRLRAAPRVVKRKMSNYYGVKRAEHRNWPRPTRRPAQAVYVLAAPP